MPGVARGGPGRRGAVKFPLTAQLIAEAKQFELRSACRDCFYWRPQLEACAHDWPEYWPAAVTRSTRPDEHGNVPTGAAFCKEFELR